MFDWMLCGMSSFEDWSNNQSNELLYEIKKIMDSGIHHLTANSGDDYRRYRLKVACIEKIILKRIDKQK